MQLHICAEHDLQLSLLCGNTLESKSAEEHSILIIREWFSIQST